MVAKAPHNSDGSPHWVIEAGSAKLRTSVHRSGVAVAAAVVIPARRVRLTQGLSQIREPHASLLTAPLELPSILRVQPVHVPLCRIDTTAQVTFLPHALVLLLLSHTQTRELPAQPLHPQRPLTHVQARPPALRALLTRSDRRAPRQHPRRRTLTKDLSFQRDSVTHHLLLDRRRLESRQGLGARPLGVRRDLRQPVGLQVPQMTQHLPSRPPRHLSRGGAQLRLQRHILDRQTHPRIQRGQHQPRSRGSSPGRVGAKGM